MKLQSIDTALPTQQLLRALTETWPEGEAKLRLGNCVAILVQLSLALAGCGAVHWLMT